MDTSYLISNSTSNSTSTTNNDFEQSSSSSPSPFANDPFDGFPFLDQHGLRLYDYFGANTPNGTSSPLINQYPLIDHLDIHQQPKNSPFQTDPCQQDDDDLQGTLASFAGDLGADSDAGYTSGVDLFATNNIVDCSDSTEAYYLRLTLEQNNNINAFNNCNINNNYSDISNNYNVNNFKNFDGNSYNNCNSDSNASQTAKRSVLMNLLIDGSDVGAGYTSHNCRALPQRLITHHLHESNYHQLQQQQQQHQFHHQQHNPAI